MTPPTTPPPVVCQAITLVVEHDRRRGWSYTTEAHIEVLAPTYSVVVVTVAGSSPDPATVLKELVNVCDALNVTVGTPDQPIKLDWRLSKSSWPDDINQACASTAASMGWSFTPRPQ